MKRFLTNWKIWDSSSLKQLSIFILVLTLRTRYFKEFECQKVKTAKDFGLGKSRENSSQSTAQHKPVNGTAQASQRHSSSQSTAQLKPVNGTAQASQWHSSSQSTAQHKPVNGTAQSSQRHSTSQSMAQLKPVNGTAHFSVTRTLSCYNFT